MGNNKVTWKIPQNFKFRRYCRKFILGSIRLLERRTNRLRWGAQCGLVATEPSLVTLKQLQTAMGVINKSLKIRKKKSNITVACSILLRAPVTRKPLGSRMGRGKGSLSGWVANISAGRMVFQIYGYRANKHMFWALKRAGYKLPFLTKIILDPSNKANLFRALGGE